MRNVLSVDVEEYFHASEVSGCVNPASVEWLPSRVGESTKRVLELLGRHRVSATFFVLGRVAERLPQLVREILRCGHEVGCHGYRHRLVYEQTPQEFREDTCAAVEAIEDACGVTPRAYRAASYSITQRSLWALEVLAECGFTHDSSIYPIRHDRYGIPGFSRWAQVIETRSGPILEAPIATVRLSWGTVAPVGGGAYLRLLPYRYTAAGVRWINEREGRPACLYFHPWEIDCEQPRLALGCLSRWRTYGGLRQMEGKLDRLLSEFSFGRLSEVYPLEVARTALLEPVER